MHKKCTKPAKNLAQGVSEIYKFSNIQISFSDFKQPVGMKMHASNQWVQKSETIPWKDIEKKYAKLFSNKKGNVAKPLRLALGACIIQVEYGYSEVETALQIQEGPYLHFFVALVNTLMNHPLMHP